MHGETALMHLSKRLGPLFGGTVDESDGGVKSPVEKEYWKATLGDASATLCLSQGFLNPFDSFDFQD